MSILNIKFALVEVTWDDASSLEHGWVDPADEKLQPQLVKTVGFLVNESENYLVIASTTDGNWVNGRFQIPRGMVKAVKPLRRKRKTKESGLAMVAPGGATPIAMVPAEGSKPPAVTPIEDLLAKAGETVTAMKKAGDAPR
jgi:hypothetical protein